MEERQVKFSLIPLTILKSNHVSFLFLSLVTIVSGLLMTILFLSELNYYLTPEIREELLVDVSRSDKLRINVDVIFPHISCPCKLNYDFLFLFC